MRHRGGRNGVEAIHLHNGESKDLSSRFVSVSAGEKQFHGVWSRMLAIVLSLVLFIIIISIPASIEDEQAFIRKDEVEGLPSYITVVLPSVVNPDKRPLRLETIAKTWGKASHAVYVVHDTKEYPDGAQIDEQSADDTSSFPQVCLVPDTIKVDDGVPRLEYVIRQIHNTINPDFAFFVNDHTFVLPINLQRFLRLHDSSKGLYAGHALKGQKEVAFNSGASGYVLSRNTMRRIIAEWDKPDSKCSLGNASKWLQGNPGLLTAKCFVEVLNIPLLDTRDKQDHSSHMFHAYGLVRTVTGDVDDWYLNKHKALDSIFGVDSRYHHKPQKGALCCSKDTVSFHYVEAAENAALWNTLQSVKKQPSMSEEKIKQIMTQKWPMERKDIGFYSRHLPQQSKQEEAAVWKDMTEVVRKISSGVTS